MRKYEFLLYIVLMFFLAACEKPLYDDEIEPEEQELTEKDDGNDKTDDDGSNKDDNDDSDSKDDEGEEVEVDPDDIPESYEETDIVDDNDNDNNKGRTLEDALTVDEFINGDGYAGQVYVVGYIVGACTRNISNAQFTPPFTYSTAILLADKKGENNKGKVISIQLKKGKIRDMFNLVEHPENYGRKAYFSGTKNVYLGIYGMKDHIGTYGFVK